MGVVVVLDSDFEGVEVAFDFCLCEEVNPVEQDRIIADLHLGVAGEGDLPPLDVVAILFQRKAVKKFH